MTEEALQAMGGAELYDFAKDAGVQLAGTPTREQILFRLTRLTQ